MGFLNEGHRCPGGVASRVFKALLTVVIGAILGMIVVYIMDEQAVPALWMAGAALGAVLSLSIRQAVGVR